MTLGTYVLKRIICLIPILLFISIISFSLVFLSPGDPAEILMTGPMGMVDKVSVEEFREKMGLDQPVYIQYLSWMGRILHGDLGYSYMSNQNVGEAIAGAFCNTLILSVVSLALALALALPLGIISALKKNSYIDAFTRLIALGGVSIPNFWMAYILIFIFAVVLHWFPASGWSKGDDLSCMILPAITLGTSSAAILMRVTRSSLLEVLNLDYIRTARAKGLSEKSIILRHALRNALIPVITMVGLSAGFLLNGSVVVETIFGWPGIGNLVVESIYSRDYPIIQGSILFIALLFVSINLLVDIIYLLVNPRITYDPNEI